MIREHFPILTLGREVKYNRLDPDLLSSLEPLKYQHDLYFHIDPTTRIIAISMLVFSRARFDGVAHANRLMREAAEGRHHRRAPISIRVFDQDRFCIIDGNSTALNALFSGWPDIPADVDTH